MVEAVRISQAIQILLKPDVQEDGLGTTYIPNLGLKSLVTMLITEPAIFDSDTMPRKLRPLSRREA